MFWAERSEQRLEVKWGLGSAVAAFELAAPLPDGNGQAA